MCATRVIRRAAVLAIVIGLSREAVAENWPQWRGPTDNGVSTEKALPTKWSKTENVVWRLPLPGPAGATPVVWENRIFLTSADEGDLVLICCSTDGKELWKRKVGAGNETIRGDEGNWASPSPSTDGKHVWTYMGSGDLACFDFDGTEVWHFNVQDRYGKFSIYWGMAVTPLLDGERLYLSLIHSGGSKVVALDKNSGAEIWQQARITDARDESEQSYASPIIYRNGSHEFLLSHGADYLIAHDLKDGHELWRVGGLNPKGRYNNSLRLIASPVAAPGLIVVPSAKNGPVLGIAPAAGTQEAKRIDDSDFGVIWTRPAGTPDVSSPLVYGGLVYLCRENGFLICLDATTGKEYYNNRTHVDRHRASPVYADGKIYVTARDGTVTVVKAGKEFEVLASNDMEESITASPLISNGTLYLRSFEALYAIRQMDK
jgi:outer membrane protein assembly factor BamB